MNATTKPLMTALHGVEAYREFDADSSAFGRPKKYVSVVDEIEQHKAEFILMALKSNPTERESFEAGRALAHNLTDAMAHELARALLKGELMKASNLAREWMNTSAEYYADAEVTA